MWQAGRHRGSEWDMTINEHEDVAVGAGRPALIIFDVNETLSDMGPLRDSFAEVGLGSGQVDAWFAGVLRDAFALTCVGVNPGFAGLASEALRVRLAAREGSREDVQSEVDRVMSTLTSLPVHPDVVAGIKALRESGIRMTTLSNGPTRVAEGLLDRAGVSDAVERLLSVEDAGVWKPHPASYAYALAECGVSADEAMLVAVHPWDIDGAGRAGLRTGWLNRSGARYPSYFRAPEVEAVDLTQLARLLG